MDDIALIVTVAFVALIIAIMALIIALAKRKPSSPGDWLELDEGDIVVVDDCNVTVRRLGAIAVEKEIFSDKDDSTITFKAGRKVQKIKIT